jgi:soluble lytic murein transglycosylase-like protein
VLARARWSVVVFALVAGGAVPAGASELDGIRGELSETRGELSEARGELEDIERVVRRTRDEVAAADERLRAATTELDTVRTQLADAEQAMVDADARERATAAALSRADEGLQQKLATWRSRRDLLEARAVAAYKHGGAVPSEILVRGVAQAGDWHEIAVTLETVDRVVTSDRLLVETTADATRDAAGARAEVTSARSDALSARREAAQERRRVEQLLARQQAVVVRIDDEAARRAEALQRIESDASARAVLVRDLERRVESLRLAALTPTPVPVTVDLEALGPAPAWAGRLPAAGRTWSPAIEAAAAAHGVDGRLLAAVVWTESNFQPGAVSHAGAIGLAQLMPGTARGLGVDPRDPLQNLSGGAAYLRTQLQTFGRADLALAAYNAGPGRVTRAGHRIPEIVETQLYVVRVLERYEQLLGAE